MDGRGDDSVSTDEGLDVYSGAPILEEKPEGGYYLVADTFSTIKLTEEQKERHDNLIEGCEKVHESVGLRVWSCAYPDEKIVVKIKPTQCAEFSWRETEEARDYFESQGIKIIKSIKLEDLIGNIYCEACTCGQRISFYFLIPKYYQNLALSNNLSISECRKDFSENFCIYSNGKYVDDGCLC